MNSSETFQQAALWGLTAALSIGCASIAGLDDLVPAAGGTGGVGAGGIGGTGGSGTAGGGSGGSGTGGSGASGGAGIALPDWTEPLEAVYLFETDVNLGLDAANANQSLTPYGDANRSNPGDSWPQGQHALVLGATGYLSNLTSPHFAPAADDKFTWGGWFRVTDAADMPAMTRLGPSGGYQLSRVASPNTAVCTIAGIAGVVVNATAPQSWLQNDWTHVVCRYDGASSTQLTVLVDGTPVDSTAVTDGAPQGGLEFRVGAADGVSYVGQMDELFFAGFAASDDAIRRIWACGIDGRRCACAVADETQFADCGRAGSTCLDLPPSCSLADPGKL